MEFLRLKYLVHVCQSRKYYLIHLSFEKKYIMIPNNRSRYSIKFRNEQFLKDWSEFFQMILAIIHVIHQKPCWNKKKTILLGIDKSNWKQICGYDKLNQIISNWINERVATKGQRPLLMAKLLEGGSCVGSHDWSQCPLYLTTKYLGYRGRCQLSKFLVTAGSDPTTMDPDGKSSLYWSLRNRDYDLFRFMIDSCNPRCWAVLMDRNIEDLLGNMPEELLLFLQNQWYNPVSLAAQCRLVIRTHLLKISGNRSLFLRVPSLPLPARLIRFLLLEQQPPQEETIPCFMKNTSVKKSRD